MADKVREMFGPDAGRIELIAHLLGCSKKFEGGDFKTGWLACIEEIASVTDHVVGDGKTTVQTLVEQMIGLLDGDYGLVELTHDLRAKTLKLLTEQSGSA